MIAATPIRPSGTRPKSTPLHATGSQNLRWQPITKATPVVTERLYLMDASTQSNYLGHRGAAPTSQSQELLCRRGFQRVKIGGDDNRCWVRAPWFSLLHQHTQNNTLAVLQAHIEKIVAKTQDPQVARWYQLNPAGITNAFKELTSFDGLRNHTLDANGYFSPAVESMIDAASRTLFLDNPELARAVFKNTTVSAYDLFTKNQGGYQVFGSLLLTALGAKAAMHSERFQCDASPTHANIDVEWMGNHSQRNRQKNCIIFHRDTKEGHFEIALKDDTFAPAPIRPRRHVSSLVQPKTRSHLSSSGHRMTGFILACVFHGAQLKKKLKALVMVLLASIDLKTNPSVLERFRQTRLNLARPST